MILGEITDPDNKMNPLYFGREPADIQIRINLEIWIRILDHFCLRFWHCWRFALSEYSLVYVNILLCR